MTHKLMKRIKKYPPLYFMSIIPKSCKRFAIAKESISSSSRKEHISLRISKIFSCSLLIISKADDTLTSVSYF